MNRSRVGKALLALLALAAVAAGATGGRAATLALSRAVGVAGNAVAEIQPDATALQKK